MTKKTFKTVVQATQPAEAQPSEGGRFIRLKDGSLIKASEIKTNEIKNTDFNDQQLDKPADVETQTSINQ